MRPTDSQQKIGGFSKMPDRKTNERDQDPRTRIRYLCDSLARFFVGRSDVIRLMATSAVAGEPLLLLGEPGTGKSDLVVKFAEALGLERSDYFEYLLTQFTEPSEILGPIDLEQLRQGRHKRRMEGMLPTAKLVFLDEIFHANSAILNVLLTILNERKVYDDGTPQPIAMKAMFAASNELPEGPQLAALGDRFPLKVLCESVCDSELESLVQLGIRHESSLARGQRPWAEGLCTLTDIELAQQTMLEEVIGQHDAFVPPDVREEFFRWVRTLRAEFRIPLSDRRVVRLYKLMRVHAWLFGSGQMTTTDLGLFRFAADRIEDLSALAERLPTLLESSFRTAGTS